MFVDSLWKHRSSSSSSSSSSIGDGEWVAWPNVSWVFLSDKHGQWCCQWIFYARDFIRLTRVNWVCVLNETNCHHQQQDDEWTFLKSETRSLVFFSSYLFHLSISSQYLFIVFTNLKNGVDHARSTSPARHYPLNRSSLIRSLTLSTNDWS